MRPLPRLRTTFGVILGIFVGLLVFIFCEFLIFLYVAFSTGGYESELGQVQGTFGTLLLLLLPFCIAAGFFLGRAVHKGLKQAQPGLRVTKSGASLDGLL